MPFTLTTTRLRLVLESAEVTRARMDRLPAEQRAEISSDWLAKIQAAKVASPWLHGFAIRLATGPQRIGSCGFKGPPSAGVVEIAYSVAPEFQGLGYGTEAAQSMVGFAFDSPEVQLVRAHTLPKCSASTRILTKCGFQHVGEVNDPEDGLIWRWERSRDADFSGSTWELHNHQ